MPKSSKEQNALKNTRKFWLSVKHSNCGNSDSEESTTSSDSGDLAHIPIPNPPSLDNISLNENKNLNMEDIGTQLQKMMQMMEEFALKQREHDTMFQELESHINATNSNTQPRQPAIQQELNVDQLFKIPDPIKMLPTFDGNTRQLNSWLTTAEDTLNAFKQHVSPLQYKMYVTTVINKIQGKAKDVICNISTGNPDNFETVKEVLINSLIDRQELSTYKCQLWQCRMTDGMNISKYYNKSKTIIHNIKTLAKQKEKYRNNWEIINEFIDEDALAAFIAGLNEPYFGYVQAARPNDVEDAYAFLCKFKAKEITAYNIATEGSHKKFQKHKEPDYKQNSKTHQTNSKNYNQYNKLENQPKDRTMSGSHNLIEPMDTATTRSRLTINNRMINNHETTCHNNEHDTSELKSNCDSEDDLDLNFQLDSTNLILT